MALGRAARSWWSLGIQVALLLVAVGLLQVVAERSNTRVDLTPTRALSLSPITRNVLAEVKAPLAVTVFFRRGEREQYTGLLERLRAETPDLRYELYDLDRYPERARSVGITQPGRAAIEYEGRRVVVPALPEEHLAGGILEAVRGRARHVAIASGHGERVPSGEQTGLGRLMTALDAEGWRGDVVSLRDGPLPPDTDVVLVAGPERDFSPDELQTLAAFLRDGGGVILLLDPAPLPNLTGLLASLGIRLGDDFVVDRERQVLATDGLAAVVEQFRRGNPISEPERNPIGSGAVFPSARTVDVIGPVPGVAAESIAITGDTAWAMADAGRARRGEEPSKAARDVPGPHSVMVLAEAGGGAADGKPARRGRLIVIGDSDFATDGYLDLLGNRDIALNAFAWAGGDEALAGARPKSVPEVQRPLSPLVLTDAQARRLLTMVAVVQPGLVLVAGFVIVGLRRRRG